MHSSVSTLRYILDIYSDIFKICFKLCCINALYHFLSPSDKVLLSLHSEQVIFPFEIKKKQSENII